MEVPGKKLLLKTSAVDTTYCQPCFKDGDNLPADAYCTVCKEFLCSNCASVHKKLKISRSHALLDKFSMPTSMSGDDDEYIEWCEIHPKEFIKYFCPTHQTLNCGHCVVQNHRSCHVDVISDLSQAFKDGPEYCDIDKAIAKLFKDIDKCVSDVEKNKTLIAEMSECEVSKLRRCRDEVNKYFEERENALLGIIDQMKNIDEALLDNLRPKCDNLKTEVEEIKKHLKTQENNTIQLFIKAKRAKQLLEITQTALAEINKKNTIHQYRFNIDSATERLMESNTGLGIVEKEVIDTQNALGMQIESDVDLTELKLIRAASIPVKSPIDTRDCFISSMLLLPMNMLLLADWHNDTLKLVDLQTSSMVSHVSVPGKPWGMCLLPGDRVAVTMETIIQFLETKGQLTLSDSIKVDDDCRGIAHHDGSLIVSYFSGKLQILNMKGGVIRKTEKYMNGQQVLVSPFHLIVARASQTAFVYVSDIEMNTITKLDMNLNFLQTFRDPALKGPMGISVFANQLIICCVKRNNIICINLSSGKMSQLHVEDDVIPDPEYCVYSPLQKKLYVTFNKHGHANHAENSVKVYNAIE
ncbi:uncharacterized protein LOC128213196 isoform X1 [Mya arenaria]|uniref:uncharacterized protein LOC128213196 isoform X1 n=1 Tax=Mya arenaria TaxID=6604 RepID=UPI0022E4B37E|nr:uncharacterized protein LOC128213196 isoform X1 [Mya arenaria]XP_052774710.1 uncharacterized protein LOC128213196 isoform X1 [Mya arenaria]XP_052774711.1 uncharacterized protein LOC128213196 isoform X1 [Mya arenaria]XP_052774712.1 uncharacterized protein LOC128213196 isoform X1 [Mya arenaria]